MHSFWNLFTKMSDICHISRIPCHLFTLPRTTVTHFTTFWPFSDLKIDFYFWKKVHFLEPLSDKWQFLAPKIFSLQSSCSWLVLRPLPSHQYFGPKEVLGGEFFPPCHILFIRVHFELGLGSQLPLIKILGGRIFTPLPGTWPPPIRIDKCHTISIRIPTHFSAKFGPTIVILGRGDESKFQNAHKKGQLTPPLNETSAYFIL